MIINRSRTYASVTLLLLPFLFLLTGFTLEPQSLPQGVYAVTIADENFPARFPAEGRPALSGKWELSLLEGSRAKITKDGELVVEGHYSSTTDRFMITDETGTLSCAKEPGKETGTYKWTIKEDKLILKGIDDKCDGRRFILTLLPWTKQK
jgi:hypothetical protein